MGLKGAPAGKKADGGQMLSRVATNGGHGEESSYFDGWKAYEADPYHPEENGEGVIQMGLAENQLCHDLIQDWILLHPEASVCTPEGSPGFRAVANFQDYHGLPSFRRAVAGFMGKVRGGRARFDPDRVVMSGGATGAQETIAFCLADPGDAFLIPTPYYPGFDRDFRWRTGARLVPVHCDSSNGFMVTASALESAYEGARAAGVRVKGLLLTNPSNPLGTTMDRATLEAVVAFINAKRIHLVCDEIFAGTSFAGPDFLGVSEILEDDPAGCDPRLVHIVYSLSKVLGLPGFRVGVIYSYNDEVVSCARKMSSFGLVSTQTQHFLASLLSDDAFTSRFLAESALRLRERHRAFTSGLAQVGIRCLGSNAGLFCWMDLRPLLKEPTAEEELSLWRVIVHEGKLNVSPGTSFHCSEPGWFRVCFANIDSQTMEVALRRIRSLVDRSTNGARAPAAKKRSWQGPSLRLSMGRSRRFDDLTIMTPSLMSPRSPLVHAAT